MRKEWQSKNRGQESLHSPWAIARAVLLPDLPRQVISEGRLLHRQLRDLAMDAPVPELAVTVNV